MKKGVFAGSFDPLHNGHIWLIEEGSKLFDELVISIGLNPDKKYLFNLEEKIYTIEESVKHLPNVKVDTFGELFLVDYMKSIGAKYSLRGIRGHSDLDFEQMMRNINSDLSPDMQTVFLMTPREHTDVSSTLVKGLVGPKGWEDVVKKYVPKAVYEKFVEKFQK